MNNNNYKATLSKELNECFQQGKLADQGHMDTTKVVYFLMNETEFKECIGNLPHIDFYDMVLAFAYLTTSEHLNSFLMITNEMAESNHLSLTDLVDLAQRNTHHMFPSSMVSFGKFMFEHNIESSSATPEEIIECAIIAAMDEKDPKTASYILSANNYRFGATALLDTPYLDRMAGELESDLTMLPTSDGEFLVYTDSQCRNVQELRKLADSALNKGNEKILTRLIFRYSRATKQLQQIA